MPISSSATQAEGPRNGRLPARAIVAGLRSTSKFGLPPPNRPDEVLQLGRLERVGAEGGEPQIFVGSLLARFVKQAPLSPGDLPRPSQNASSKPTLVTVSDGSR